MKVIPALLRLNGASFQADPVTAALGTELDLKRNIPAIIRDLFWARTSDMGRVFC